MQPEELLKLAKKEKLGELESEWMAHIEEGAEGLPALLDTVRVLARRGHGELAETLLWYLALALRERGGAQEALEAVRRGADALPQSELLRDMAADLCRDVYADRADVDDLLRLSVKARDLPLNEALVGLRNLTSVRRGSYVLDGQRGTVGRVVELDAERGGLVVELAEGEKVYGPGLVARLDPAEEDDFRALGVFERDRLTHLGREDPEELVRVLLSSLDRRMQLRRVRLYLEPIVGSWTRWWSRARKVLSRSAVIGMTSGGSPSLFLRSRPLSHGRRLMKRLEAAEAPVARLSAALHLLREAGEPGRIELDVLQEAAERVNALARERLDAPVALAAAAMADAFARLTEDGAAEPVGSDAALAEVLADPDALVGALDDADVTLCALEFVRRRAPQAWRDLAVAVMPLAEREVCGAVARQLRRQDAAEAVGEAQREVLARSESSPGALAWVWRECAAAGPDESPVPPAAVVIQVLNRLGALVRDAALGEEERKEQIGELRSTLFMRGGAPLREALQSARPEQLAAVKALGERVPALTERMQAELARFLRSIRPGLFEKAVPPWKEDVLYTTEAGLEKRKADLEQIAHVRLPEVIREIGQAASFGDVSDNAEYQSAVQERARLAERAARMQEEIAEARPITREMAAAGYVTVGSRVRARNLATGAEETLTFLGPWDADPEHGVYAYNAPLAQAFMGRRPGEDVAFRMGPEERRWEVIAVEPGV
jgi:transcription elongation factor GreA